MTGDGAIYADIAIIERNFNSADKKDSVTVGQQGENYKEWYAEWTSTEGQSQDTHTFRVNYPGDANYIYDLTFTDLAGNSIADYKANLIPLGMLLLMLLRLDCLQTIKMQKSKSIM